MVKNLNSSILLLIASFSLLAETPNNSGLEKEKSGLQEFDKESSLVDFEKIRTVLKKDKLDAAIDNKKEKIAVKKKEEIEKEQIKFSYPVEREFWSFATELWLVRNAQGLKWDFTRPEYGISDAFVSLLEKMGFYEIKFRILYVDSPSMSHMALPSDKDEFIFLVSVPFIRTLDLSKLEISLLLLEDFFRAKKGYIISSLTSDDLKKIMGTSFFGKAPEMKIIDDLLKMYSEKIFKKGFSFQEQYEVTKQMDSVLKADLATWNSYFSLLKKLDVLVKTNLLYDHISKIYPSPEMQVKWMEPKRPVL